MPTVEVHLSNASYSVEVAPGILSRAGEVISSLSKSRKAAVLTDSHVGPLHAAALEASLRQHGIEPIVAVIPPGEDHKTLATLLPVYDTFLRARIERTTPIIALGGGVIGDMAGFVAATLLRGVPFVQIPTSLLAMVDASVGGKTGVNTDAGKNLVGSFHQPIAVLADPQVLTTLPKRELVGGLAECIKHEVIRDADGFAALEKSIESALKSDVAYLTGLVSHNVRIKAAVVEADPFEHGERAHLNFGHTFGHAIEKVSRYAYSHGESVGLGMVAAAELAVALGMLDAQSRDRIVQLVRRAGLPIDGMKLDPAAVYDAMSFDKKVRASRVRFILPDRIGHAVIRDDAPVNLIRNAIDALR